MARRRKRPRLEPGEVERALTTEPSCGEAPPLARLLLLIRALNPTGLTGLDDDARRRRYARKARLQSVIIAAHPGALVAVPTRWPGVVALRLAEGRGDAGHARLADLDASARAWVTRSLQQRRR